MKKHNLFLMLALMLAVALTFSSCGDVTARNLDGTTWEGNIGGIPLSLKFTSTTKYEMSMKGMVTDKGSFDISSKDTITFTPDDGTTPFKGTVDKDTMIVKGVQGGDLTLTKKK